MLEKLTSLKNLILESPGWKTVFSVIIPIITGVLSGTFVAEITANNLIVWHLFYRTYSFYGLLLSAAIVYAYYNALYDYEKNIEKFRDSEYCTAYMRSKCLPELAQKYIESIRNGSNGELKKAMQEIERIFK